MKLQYKFQTVRQRNGKTQKAEITLKLQKIWIQGTNKWILLTQILHI